MILHLTDSLTRGLVVGAALLIGLWLSFFGLRAAIAHYGYEGVTRERMELAVRLEPGNPEYWYRLGHYHEFNIEERDSALAQQCFRKAIALNPLYTNAWLDLATDYELEGRTAEAHEAYLQAKKSYPTSGNVSWRYGNFLLRQGDQPEAYAELRRAIEADPQLAAAAFSRAYRANPDIDELLEQVLPPKQSVYVNVIWEALSAKQLAVARTVWARLIKLHPHLEWRDVDRLVSDLLQAGEFTEARHTWDQGMSTMNLPPLLQPSQPKSGGSLYPRPGPARNYLSFFRVGQDARYHHGVRPLLSASRGRTRQNPYSHDAGDSWHESVDPCGGDLDRRSQRSPCADLCQPRSKRQPGCAHLRNCLGRRCEPRAAARGASQAMRFFRISIYGLLAFAVLAFGAVEEWSQAVLEVGAAILFFLWAVQRYRQKTEGLVLPPELFPLCAFALVVVCQLIFHLTASRYYTRSELQLLITYMVLLFLTSQAFVRRSHWRGFVWFVMTLGFLVSVFAILQHLTFNGKLYWFREMRFGGLPFGPYVNRNHFAGFAEMVIPVALVPLVLGKVRRERLFLVALFAMVPIVALLLSASRGGIVSFAVQMLLLFVLLLIRRIRSRFVIAGGVVVLCAAMFVSWIGVQQVLSRFAGIETLEVSAGKRSAMRQGTWRLFLDHPLLGTGLGTFEIVFPPYDSVFDGKIANHAHNDYLEVLAETGMVGGLCCLWFLWVVLLQSLKGMAELGESFGSALNLAGLVACSGILVHSLVDFNLRIPANALLFFVSAHLAALRLPPGVPEVAENEEQRKGVRKH